MKAPRMIGSIAVVLVLAALMAAAQAEDTVTISKERLQELEQKEKELEALKGTANKPQPGTPQQEKTQTGTDKAQQQELEQKQQQLEKVTEQLKQAQGQKKQLETETQQLKSQTEQLQKEKQAAEQKAAVAAAAAARAEPVIAHDTPALTSLPPLKQGEVVDSMDLMNHYRADPLAAAKRYGNGLIRVEGEIVGLSKPPFVRPYEILLQTTERKWKVVCRVEPPEALKAIFTANHGEEMVGTTNDGRRYTLARVGLKAVVVGRCKGLKDQEITLSSCGLVSVK